MEKIHKNFMFLDFDSFYMFFHHKAVDHACTSSK